MTRVRVEATGEATSLADRKRRAGQRLILGFEGVGVTEDLRRIVREVRPAGFLVFGGNFEEVAQLPELTRELASLCDPARPALLGVDQEGGRVHRIGEPATRWPPMRAVGRAEDLTAPIARAIAREIRALGFNLDFAPVADVDSNPANPVIGDRSFGERPEEVAEHVAVFVDAMQAEGVVACAKHFPGHGDTAQDSHHALPRVEREEPDLRRTELVPFAAAVRAGVGAVMAAHVVYPAWDEDRPASLSARIAPRLLREELGFQGVLLTDDLAMEAVRRWSPAELARDGTAATVDVFLASGDAVFQLDLFRELVVIQEDDPAGERTSADAVARVDALRERFFLAAPPPPGLDVLGSAEHRMLAELARARGGMA